MAAATKWAEFIDWFEAPGWSGVYLLGTYSRYATLYSQQVRALNLVAALARTGRLERGTRVAIVGGGAAGLTASAAAALLEADVSVFERLDDVMELQRNNRQRWIHPHIYDWPDPDDDSDVAGLPILNWKAGYAEQVAGQIQAGWNEIRQKTGRIRPHYPLTNVDLVKPSAGQAPTVIWNGPADRGRQAFPVVIVAVGFGLEPLRPYQWSYWEEDSIDGGFRHRPRGERWLISGFGDSALTDLMRLKIKRFRHAELPQWFGGTRLDSVRKDLLEIHRDPRADEAQFLTERFEALATNGLEQDLKPRLRDNVQVCLTGRTAYLYEPGASILNRFVLRLLAALGAFEHRAGPLVESDIERTADGFKVRLSRGVEEFEHVLLRHGPAPALETLSRELKDDTSELKERWQKLPRGRDRTRDLRWPSGMFQMEQPAPSEAFRREAERVGVAARSLTVRKEIFASGRASLHFKIHGLTIARGWLRGVRIGIQSMAGKIGQPELDARAHQLGLRWEADPPPDDPAPGAPFRDRLAAARRNARHLSGTFLLSEPLSPDSAPISFGFTIDELNADAMTCWEFDQLYGPDDRLHIDDTPLEHQEFFARVVWFPVETLRVQVAMPDADAEQGPAASCSVFTWSRDITTDTIVSDGVLQLAPRRGSGQEPLDLGWKRIPPPPALQFGQHGSRQVWELTVRTPAVGECYSIDWHLPEIVLDDEAQPLVAEVTDIRQRLLDHRRSRLAREAAAAASALRRKFLQVSNRINTTYRDAAAGERLEVALLAYDGGARMLRVADGAVNGDGEVDPELWDFEVPFGLGLAGAAFKAVGEMYVRAEDGQRPALSSFLQVPGEPENKVTLLISVALHHAGFETYELGRSCFGVLDITSNLRNSRLLAEARRDRGLPMTVHQACRDLEGWLTHALLVK